MRPLPALALLALLAALAPVPATAQAVPETPILLLEDDTGDVAADANGNPVDVPSGGWDAMDLVSLSALETPAEVRFLLAVASLEATPQQSVLAAVAYEIVFRHLDETYKARVYVYDQTQANGELERIPAGMDPDDGYGDYVASLPVEVDVAAATIAVPVSRELLTDSKGAAPYPGRALDFFMVDAGLFNDGNIQVMGQSMPIPYVEDRMPESGAADVVLPIQHGIMQTGDLRLDSDEPFRASNGEAATFVFRVNATNIGDGTQVAEFVAVGAPQGWDVRLPGLVRLEAGQSVEVPVVVRTAFAHAHGSATAFTVELVGQDGASTGRVQLGLRYPKIAQPAGHHNTVHLHNLDDSDDPVRMGIGLFNRALSGYDFTKMPYFNTAPQEDDPTDAMTPVPGQTCESLRIQEDNDTVGTTYCWYAPLSPGLEMGLDFELDQPGSYSVPIHSLAPQPGARVQGQLVYYDPEETTDDPFFRFFYEPIVVATLLPSDRIDIAADGRQTFTGTVRAEEAGDYLPYKRGAHLELQLEVRTNRPDNFFLGPRTEPDLQPGGSLVLPLRDYEDAIDDAFAVAGGLHLALDGDSQRYANPGDTVVYTVALHNADDEGHDLAASLLGSNREWARIVGADGFGVAADGTRTIKVAVTVPADARDEDRADLVLEVASQEDVAVRSLVRLVTTVDTDVEHEDQASLLADAQAPKDTPAAPVAFLVLALLGLALRRRA